ncbi:MAG: hypothetical protein ACPGSC_13115 [Granulosicoccaceae bacterium]
MEKLFSISSLAAMLLVAQQAQAHSSPSHGLAHSFEHLWFVLVPLALWALWRTAGKRSDRGGRDQ